MISSVAFRQCRDGEGSPTGMILREKAGRDAVLPGSRIYGFLLIFSIKYHDMCPAYFSCRSFLCQS